MKANAKKLTMKTKNALYGYLFVSVWLVGFLIFTLYPLIYTVFLSFNNVRMTSSGIAAEWINFDNYKRALNIDLDFTDKISTYFSETLISVPVILVIAILIALLLSLKLKFMGFIRTIFFLPVIIVSGPVISQMLEQGAAEFSALVNVVDFPSLYETFPAFLINPIQFLLSSFIILMWFSGVQILIFLAGIKKIDKSMYEAAKIDGASVWEAFWKITLPSLARIIVINLIYTVVMQSIFSTNSIIVKISAELTSADLDSGFGYAAAISWLYFFVMLGVLLIMLIIYYFLFMFRKRGRS